MNWDTEILRAVESELSSRPLLDPDDVQAITYLKVRHSRSYEGIAACKGLKILLLVGCDSPRMPPLRSLNNLTRLTVSDSALRSLDGLEFSVSIENLQIPRNSVQDISPILLCDRLQWIDVTGNPLSDASYEEVIPELSNRGVKISAPTLLERNLMLRMRDIGLSFSYYQMSGSYRLCRPGLALTDMPEADHIKISPRDLENLLDSDQNSLRKIFDRKDLIPTLKSP